VLHELSPHEVRCLRLAAAGLTCEETAARLGRGPETVKSHLGRARLKLGARNTVHAVALAMSADLI
jgi:DNA-binding CsgD family transcriptional regulator